MSMSGTPAICVIATALVPVPAPSTIQIHETRITATSAAITTKRSRRSTVSRTVASVTAIVVPLPPSGAAELQLVLVVGVEQTVLVPGDVRQRAMAAVQVEFDGAEAFGEPGCILRLMEHPALRKHQNHLLFAVRHRVAYRLAVRANDPGNLDPRPPLVEVPVEINLGEYRILYRLDNDREDLEHRADRLVLA